MFYQDNITLDGAEGFVLTPDNKNMYVTTANNDPSKTRLLVSWKVTEPPPPKVCDNGYYMANDQCILCMNGGASYTCPVGQYRTGTVCTRNPQTNIHDTHDTQSCSTCGNGGSNGNLYSCTSGTYTSGTVCNGT